MQNRTFHIQTYGCQMNASDSDWLARSLTARGFTEAPFDEASVFILNTCSVRDKPEKKVYSELGRIARRTKLAGRTDVTVCVGGCVAQQVGPALIKRFPQVRLLFGTDGIARAPESVSRLMEDPSLRLSLLEFANEYEEREEARMSNSPASVFVNIMQGCNNFCTYCIVPYVRGRQKSRAPEAILAECRTLLEGGAREITLLGQNVNSYGLDGIGGVGGVGDGADVLGHTRSAESRGPGGDIGFAGLLRQVAALPGLERLRFVTPHPKDIAPDVIAAFGELEVLCPRLHLPLQSGSDAILKKMGRHYDTARYLDIVRALRQARPDILLTTDIIVGFPGETEEDFQATMRLMEEVGFAASFSFVYSDRPRAKAALLPGKVERAVALDRLARLQAWQNEANDRVLASQVGHEVAVLIEGPSQRPMGHYAERFQNESTLVSPETTDKPPMNGQMPDATGLAPVKGTLAPGAETVTPEAALVGGVGSSMSAEWESWQGKTPHGLIVNINLPPARGASPRSGGWEGVLVRAVIGSAARHSLKGTQAGAPW